jgi:hypothetical protein
LGARQPLAQPEPSAGQAIPQKHQIPDAGEAERVLRAKYFDWCSARIAERFMELSVPEIYELAGTEGADSSDLSFQEVMSRATAALAVRTELPAFESWSAGYRADPDLYDADLIGFWKEADPSSRGAAAES